MGGYEPKRKGNRPPAKDRPLPGCPTCPYSQHYPTNTSTHNVFSPGQCSLPPLPHDSPLSLHNHPASYGPQGYGAGGNHYPYQSKYSPTYRQHYGYADPPSPCSSYHHGYQQLQPSSLADEKYQGGQETAGHNACRYSEGHAPQQSASNTDYPPFPPPPYEAQNPSHAPSFPALPYPEQSGERLLSQTISAPVALYCEHK